MFRDDYAAAYARLETVQRELVTSRNQSVQDQQRIQMLTAQLHEAQAALARFGYQAQPRYFQFPPRGGTVLVLGILSLVVCSVMGPIAWSMGNEELRRIDSGLTSPEGRSNVMAGKVCGIISSALLMVAGFCILLVLALASGR